MLFVEQVTREEGRVSQVESALLTEKVDFPRGLATTKRTSKELGSIISPLHASRETNI